VDTNVLKPAADGHSGRIRPAAPAGAVTVAGLYTEHAVSLLRLAVVMLGDRAAAEDVVQDAFCALYRRWQFLDDQGKALAYVRSALLNRCRSQLRSRIRAQRHATAQGAASHGPSAEDDALVAEEHRQVLAALRMLPPRQREVLVLRFYLGLAVPDIAAAMGISAGTVKSTTSRALAALGGLLKEHT
jgi:RNA polymerase sigma-70 factor (sigma-E family)